MGGRRKKKEPKSSRASGRRNTKRRAPGTKAPAKSVPYRDVFEAAVVGLAVVELNGQARAVNPALCRMLGYSTTELVARPFPQTVRADDYRSIETRRQLLAQEIEGFDQETEYIRKDGSTLRGLTRARLVRNAAGQPTHFLSQIIDITSQHETELTLRESEDRSVRRAEDLERSNADLEQFAYVASHDLQQPLRTVASYVGLLAERYEAQLNDRGAGWIGRITRSVGHMQHLIDDLLRLARVKTETNGFDLTDTDSSMHRCWDRLLIQNPGVDAVLTAADLPTIEADGPQLEMLFTNLLDNSFKYRRRGIPLEVDIRVAVMTSLLGNLFQFSVRDNGIGIDPTHANEIFEIFRRLHPDDEFEGSGIGLAICRKIVARHGGVIWVDSVLGEGTTFHFTLRDSGGDARLPDLVER